MSHEIRERIVETCRAMGRAGINQGTAGNLSVRHGEGFLITPSSLSYDRMTAEDVVEMGWDGTYAGRRPSSEWRFHRDILAARGDVEVVLHCHSVHATAVACHHRAIPAFHYMVGIAGGTTIRCARYATFGTQGLSDAALEALEGRMACLLGQHGQIALGRTLEGALFMATEVETLARLYRQRARDRRAAGAARRRDGAGDRSDAADELRAGPRARGHERRGAAEGVTRVGTVPEPWA
jgi:L-fuculose-phosphate aldolase